MRRLILGTAVALTAMTTGFAQDALKSAPDVYSLILENDQVRVLRVVQAPGMPSPIHQHPAAVSVRIRGCNVTPGTARWLEPQSHSPTNTCGDTYEAVIIELKQPISAK